VYVAEDLHTSYWKGYEGGLFNQYSSISFFKNLIDVINYEHWQNKWNIGDILREYELKLKLHNLKNELKTIHSIEFTNSLCIIKKMPAEKNTLGKRVVVGNEETLTHNIKLYNDTTL
jgi:hypothetical protein